MRSVYVLALFAVALCFAYEPQPPYMRPWPTPTIPDGCDSACQAAIIDSLQVRFGDSISVPYLHATDSVRTPSIRATCVRIGTGGYVCQSETDEITVTSGLTIFDGAVKIIDSVGFFGADARDACLVTGGPSPNPVTATQVKIAWDNNFRDCMLSFGIIYEP